MDDVHLKQIWLGISCLEYCETIIVSAHLSSDFMFFILVIVDIMKDKGTTDAIFIVRQMQEKFRVKGKKLYFGFVDLEKAFDSVPREVIRWARRKLSVEEWLIAAVM